MCWIGGCPFRSRTSPCKGRNISLCVRAKASTINMCKINVVQALLMPFDASNCQHDYSHAWIIRVAVSNAKSVERGECITPHVPWIQYLVQGTGFHPCFIDELVSISLHLDCALKAGAVFKVPTWLTANG
jgi:hypothetical protein